MKMKRNKKLSSFILCMVLIVAMALTAGGCNGKTKKESPAANGAETVPQADGSVLGDGSKVFDVTIVDQEDVETTLEIHTDQETVGAALLELGLIAGEESEFGMFVKTVDGETADDSKQEWWCLTKGGETWTSGVDSTEIADGDAFEFTLTTGY